MKFKIYKDEKGEYRWTLYAVNNKKLADSAEGYKQKKDCLNGMTKVMSTTSETPIKDVTQTRSYKKKSELNK
jgi:uncharacterized protein YegP (UPF0339 family)